MTDIIHDYPTDGAATAAPGQVIFSFPMKLFDNGDIRVFVDGAPAIFNAAPTTKMQYTLIINENAEGGQIIFGTAMDGGEIISWDRKIPIDRLTRFPDVGPVPMSEINEELNRHIAIMQDIAAGASGRGFEQSEEFIATAGQTVFTMPLLYEPGKVQVYVNGLRLSNEDFSATDGINVVLDTPSQAGDVVLIETFTDVAGTAADIEMADGGTAQQAVAVAANPIALLASTEDMVPGSTVRTANGFIYEVAEPSAVDHHIITAGGVKLYSRDPMLTPDALGAPVDGLSDAAPFIERALQISKSIALMNMSVYLLASVIGVPDQNLYAPDSQFIWGNGADLVLSSPLTLGTPEAIFTSAAAKASPESTSNLYSGKLYLIGLDITQSSTSVLLNGDRLYQAFLSYSSIDGVDTIAKSFRPKATYANGYMQSFTLDNCQVSDVRRLVDAKRAYDITISNNKCSNCTGGVYVDGLTEDPAINVFRWTNNLFQGGGLAVSLGKFISATFTGQYLEANTLGDAATQKCDIWLRAGPSPSSGCVFTGIGFQPHPSQIADTGYVSVRIDYDVTTAAGGLPRMEGCWSSGSRMVSPNKAELVGCGSASATMLLNAMSPASPAAARVSFSSASITYLASTNLSAGVYRVLGVDVQYLKSLVAADSGRPVMGELQLLLQHKTAGGVVNGTTAVTVGFVVMAASEGVSTGNRVNDVYAGFWLKDQAPVPSGSIIDTLGAGATTRVHFTAPALTFDRVGDVYGIKLSGYAAPSNPNYGAADRIFTHATVVLNARNNGGVLTNPLALAS